MKWRFVILAALGPVLGYVLISESMYQLWERGAASPSAPSFIEIVGGLIGALLTAPGTSMGSYEIGQHLISFFGYEHEPAFSYHRRWFDFHVPMFLTAAALFGASLAILTVVRLTLLKSDAAV
jgi:hypothetical protein